MPGPNNYDGVIREVLNSTMPTSSDDQQAQGLVSMLRKGDQASPRSGFSYLDNIARVLLDPDPSDVDYKGVLLDQLMNRTNAGAREFRSERGGQLIPTDIAPGPSTLYPRASDIPGDASTIERREKYYIPTPNADTYGQAPKRRKT